MSSSRFCIPILAALLSAPWGAAAPLKFNRDVRPLLSDACFHCHGFDKNARKGGLRLDLPEESLKPAKSGAVPIVPGKPDESEVMKRILSHDPEETMPPAEAHKVLKPEQIAMLKQWITEGAKYEVHWAYTPLQMPAVATAKPEAVIDAFLQEKLKAEGLDFSPAADRATLLRRLSLDLLGLPPTPAEVQSFLKDKSPQAFATAVERLLASPHFGERWAVWWLDLARFTDTVGFHGDQNQRIFPYRDYVVDSFNADKSFAQFGREQLAGDLLPQPTKDQLVATGFNRLNMMTREGGAQPGEYLAKYGAERTRTVSNAFLGSTFGCAECHDHKFDPILTKDFYSLQAFFADLKQWGVYADYGYTPNPDLKGYNNDFPFPPETQVENKYLKGRMVKLEQAMKTASAEALAKKPKLQAAFTAWQAEMKTFLAKNPQGWQVAMPTISAGETPPAPAAKGKAAKAKAKAKDADKDKPAPAAKPAAPAKPAAAALGSVATDGTIHALSAKPDQTLLTCTPGLAQISCIKLEALPHVDFKGSILRSGTEASATVKFSIRHQPKDKPPGKPLGLYHAEANFFERRYEGGQEVIGVQAGWTTGKSRWNQAQQVVYVLEMPLTLQAGDRLLVDLSDNVLGNFRISFSPMLQESGMQPTAKPEQAHTFLASTGADGEELKRLRQLQRQFLECFQGKAWSMVTEAREPQMVRVLPRGNWMDTTGEVVTPATPHFLPAHPETGKRRLTRLDLADWLFSDKNPLTARATVNRVWKQFFGAGISSNLDDMGFQGDPPSHPELMDWLACQFRDGGWNFKNLIRLIVNSRAYQQGSSLRSEIANRDPSNRWLSSQNPRRLEAEFVRDNALAIAGLLQPELGGPSVKPYQPDGYYAALQFPSRKYEAETDDRQWRRGLYMHWQRTFLHPMLANFDAPMRDECLANRVYSNTPQQALTLLNDPTFSEAALALAARLIQEEAVSDVDKLTKAYWLALARAPRAEEMTTLLAFLKKQQEEYRQAPEDAKKLTTSILRPVNASLPVTELAAWASTCRVVLNLHETITRY